MDDLYKYERELIEKGIEYIAGIDEVGRGPLVGPVVCACVVLPKNFTLKGLNDSKKLSPKRRDFFYDIIMEQALGIGIGVIDEKRIDEINIYQATKEGMIEAFNNVKCKIEHVLIDAMPLILPVPTTSIIKGDSKSLSIAAASVIAKVTRDRMMDELDEKHPMYGFKRHKGYPTKEHVEAINKYGIINEHRKSYKPVMDVINKQQENILHI
jgi:ribonuclease HII